MRQERHQLDGLVQPLGQVFGFDQLAARVGEQLRSGGFDAQVGVLFQENKQRIIEHGSHAAFIGTGQAVFFGELGTVFKVDVCLPHFGSNLIEQPFGALEELRQRLEYELSIIKQVGFSGYFLIVADFIGYARNNGIPVGPGRGSAAGSLAAYSLASATSDFAFL